MTPAEEYLALEGVATGARWVARRKEAFLIAIKKWPEEAPVLMERHHVSAEEVVEWAKEYQQRGRQGLKATKLQYNRA